MKETLEYAKKVLKSALDNFPIEALALLAGWLIGLACGAAIRDGEWFAALIELGIMVYLVGAIFKTKMDSIGGSNDHTN